MCSEDLDRKTRRHPLTPSGEGPIVGHARYDEKNGELVITRVLPNKCDCDSPDHSIEGTLHCAAGHCLHGDKKCQR